MLAINNAPAPAWPVNPSATGQPVAPVTAVSAAKRSSHDPRQSSGEGRESASSTSGSASAKARSASADSAQSARQASAQAEEAQRAKEAAAEEAQAREQAEREAQGPQLQEALSKVWEASAAVVERVLGLDESAGNAATAGADASAPVAQEGEASSRLAAAAQGPQSPDTQEVVAYDENGNGTAAPVELGVIISERV